MVEKRIQDFIDAINAKVKSPMMMQGTGRYGVISRFSSGIFEVDLSLGGGWPFGRIHVIAGNESTGKTLLALFAMKEVESYDHFTKKHKELIPEKERPFKFRPGHALYMDFEGTFDTSWASAVGVNCDDHTICRPDTGEMGIDIVRAAILEDIYDLIVIDSIAAMVPLKEMEISAEDQTMGLHPRLVNKAVRVWTSALQKVIVAGKTPPAIIMINQFREKLGIMFGDPRTMPGGKGQRFFSSIIVYTKTPKSEDTDEAIKPKMQFHGYTDKNKTAAPYVNYAFDFYHKPTESFKKCQVDNEKDLFKRGKDCGLIKIEKGQATFGKYSLSTKEFLQRLYVSEEMKKLLWRSIMNKTFGAYYN